MDAVDLLVACRKADKMVPSNIARVAFIPGLEDLFAGLRLQGPPKGDIIDAVMELALYSRSDVHTTVIYVHDEYVAEADYIRKQEIFNRRWEHLDRMQKFAVNEGRKMTLGDIPEIEHCSMEDYAVQLPF